jgi:hypothetical protein
MCDSHSVPVTLPAVFPHFVLFLGGNGGDRRPHRQGPVRTVFYFDLPLLYLQLVAGFERVVLCVRVRV